MKTIIIKSCITSILVCVSFFLTAQEFYDFESGDQGWVTGNDNYTSSGNTSGPSTWGLSSTTGGYAPVTLSTVWYGTPSIGYPAERSWIASPSLTVNSTTVSVNFDSYSSNEGGYPTYYDVEHVQVSINGGAFSDLHAWDANLHLYKDLTSRNITYTTSASIGDDIIFRFLYDTGDGCCGPTDVSGWYIDNVAVTGASSCILTTSITPPTSPIYYGYSPMSCTTIEASSAGANGAVTYTWSMDTNPNDGQEFATICATAPGCILVTVDAVDAAGCTAQATMLVEVVDVLCHDKNGNPKVLICHDPTGKKSKTLCVAPASVPAHLAHGDMLGDCNAGAPCSGSAKRNYANAQHNANAPKNNLEKAVALSQPSAKKQSIASEYERVQLFPNPASEVANIRIHELLEGKVDVKIYDQMGNNVMTINSETINGQAIQLNIESLENGIYEVNLDFGNNVTYSQKLIVVK